MLKKAGSNLLKTHYFMRILILISALLMIVSCKNDTTKNLSKLDLMSYGIPISINAPDSADVKVMDMIVQKDITVKKGEDYSIQIFSMESTGNDLAQLKREKLSQVKGNRYFSKIVKESDDGFLFERKIDSTKVNYDFRYFKIMGDKEYIFQTGLIGDFNQEQVQKMYDSVKQ